jgi:hypothetical protein
MAWMVAFLVTVQKVQCSHGRAKWFVARSIGIPGTTILQAQINEYLQSRGTRCQFRAMKLFVSEPVIPIALDDDSGLCGRWLR